jgi:hypothetical protein
MKKSQLKQLLKPLVNECIKESLIEDGLISGIIAEVVKGMNTTTPIVETKTTPTDPDFARLKKNAFNEEKSNKLQEHRNKLLKAVGRESYNGVNLFEGTTPAPSQSAASQMGSPVSNQDPSDPGVDIAALTQLTGRSWNAHMDNLKETK